MKKALLVVAVLLSFSISAFAQVEDVAKDVLNAYKSRDAELLKKHASAILKMSISEDYFKDESLKKDLKAVDNWDGKIREVRYETKNMMGANVVMATAYFADVPGKDKINVVLLSNLNDTGWTIFGNGISSMAKEEFNQLSKVISAANAPAEKKSQKQSQRAFRVEMASGDTFDNVSEERFEEMFNELNDDNFYIILNDGNNYLQAAFSDKGYTVEYQDEKGHFTAHDILSKDKTISLFRKYYQEGQNWREGITWDKD